MHTLTSEVESVRVFPMSFWLHSDWLPAMEEFIPGGTRGMLVGLGCLEKGGADDRCLISCLEMEEGWLFLRILMVVAFYYSNSVRMFMKIEEIS